MNVDRQTVHIRMIYSLMDVIQQFDLQLGYTWVRTETCYWLELSHVTLTCRLYDFSLISMNIDKINL